MKSIVSGKGGNEEGQAITETVITLLFLIMMSFGLLEISRMIAFKSALRIAAGEIASIAAQMEKSLTWEGGWRQSRELDAESCKPWKEARCQLGGKFRERLEASAEAELWDLAGGKGRVGPFLKLSVTVNTIAAGRIVQVDLQGCYRPFARFAKGPMPAQSPFNLDSFGNGMAERNCFGQFGNRLGGVLDFLSFKTKASVPIVESRFGRKLETKSGSGPTPIPGTARTETERAWAWLLRRLGGSGFAGPQEGQRQ